MKHFLLWAGVAALIGGCSSAVTKGDSRDAGVVVGPASGPTTEGGGQASFSVVLHSKPSSDVVLGFSVDNPAEGALLTSSLTFTKVNWDAPQSVLVAGADDDLVDGTQPFNVLVDTPVTSDNKYEDLEPFSIPLANVDNETAMILVSNTSATLAEIGTEADIVLRLSARPSADVSVAIESSDPAEASVFPATVNFAVATWDTPKVVTITGEDDDAADGNKNIEVVFGQVTSADPAFDGLAVEPVPLINLDDDLPAIFTTVLDGVSSESGGTASVTVRLGSQPSEDVTVGLAVSEMTEATLDVTELVFDSTNWSVPQIVTATGLDDGVTDGHQPFDIQSTATSVDPDYDNLTGSPVSLTNVDDETAAATVTPLIGLTSETGDQVTVSVVLNSQPTADVTIPVRSGNPSEGAVDTTSLTFTPMDWDMPHSFTVTGVRDIVVDGHTNYSVAFDAAVSADPVYSGYVAPPVKLTNVDAGTGPRALVLDDFGSTSADAAGAALGMDIVVVGNEAAFNSELDLGPYDLIILEVSSLVLGSGAEARIASWTSAGGLVLASYSGLDASPALQSLFDVQATPFSGWRYVFNNPAAQYSHFGGLQSMATVINGASTVADSGSGLTPGAGAVVTTHFDSANSGLAATVVTRGGQVIVNGFAPDDASASDEDGDTIPDVQELYENQFARLFSPTRFDSNELAPILDDFDPVVGLNVHSYLPVKAVRVSLHLTHTFDGDVNLFLRSPGTTEVDLSSDNGSGGDDFGTSCDPDDARTIFSDDAPTPITAGMAPFVGEHQPEDPLSSFIGEDPNGIWELEVVDDGFGDEGVLRCWSLFLEY